MLDCQMSIFSCLAVNSAIQHLEGSANPGCSQMGANARQRYEAFGYGFRNGSGNLDPETDDVDMYVKLEDNPFGPPTDRNTYVNPSGVVLITELMGGLIAHEEAHHLGIGHPQATDQGSQCFM